MILHLKALLLPINLKDIKIIVILDINENARTDSCREIIKN